MPVSSHFGAPSRRVAGWESGDSPVSLEDSLAWDSPRFPTGPPEADCPVLVFRGAGSAKEKRKQACAQHETRCVLFLNLPLSIVIDFAVYPHVAGDLEVAGLIDQGHTIAVHPHAYQDTMYVN